MADDFNLSESNTRCNDNQQEHLASSESESMACNDSVDVNVRGPIRSHKDYEY